MECSMGVLEDVVIKMEDLFVLVDFVILKMEEDTHTPIILRRPFLSLYRVLYWCEKW